MQNNSRTSLKRTVYISESGFCQCEGSFWKTCSLRVIHNLPCYEAIVSITPIQRGVQDRALDVVRGLDDSLTDLTDQLRFLEDKFKI